MKQLDPKAVWLFFINSMLGFIFVLVFPIFIFTSFIFSNIYWISHYPSNNFLVFLAEKAWTIFIPIMLLFSVLSYIWAKLSYNFYRYELTSDGFRKEQGVVGKNM